MLRCVAPKGTPGDKCMGGGKHTWSESQGDRKVLLPQIHTNREVGGGAGVIVALQSSHFQAYSLTLFCQHGTAPQEAGGSTFCVCPRKGQKHSPAQTTAGAPFAVLLFQVGSKRRDNITLPFTHKR